MVNKDQLDQTPEGQQVLALLAQNFTAEQFQPALTLIEQRYTEDQTVWDAELNCDSKLPFHKTTDAHRLLVFFASPSHLAKIKRELAQRAAETPIPPTAAPVVKTPARRKPKSKGQTKRKVVTRSKATQGRKAAGAKVVKKKSPRAPRKKLPMKRARKRLQAKTQKSRPKSRTKKLSQHK